MTAFLSFILSTITGMAVKYFMNSEVIEGLILLGAEKLVEATDSDIDNEVLELIKNRVNKP